MARRILFRDDNTMPLNNQFRVRERIRILQYFPSTLHRSIALSDQET